MPKKIVLLNPFLTNLQNYHPYQMFQWAQIWSRNSLEYFLLQCTADAAVKCCSCSCGWRNTGFGFFLFYIVLFLRPFDAAEKWWPCSRWRNTGFGLCESSGGAPAGLLRPPTPDLHYNQHYHTVCSSVVLYTSYSTTLLHTSYTTLHTASCFPAIIWNADWAESVISLNTTGGVFSGTVSSATTSGISGGTVQA